MSTENVDSTAPSCCSQQPGQPAASCGCPCRKWIYGSLILLILVAGGAWGVIWLIGGNLRSTPQYQAAMQKIQSDATLRNELGQPITDSWRTAGEPEDMYFEIQGPKGSAKVHAKARLAQGKWDLIQLEVTLPSDKRLQVPLGGAGDAPVFSTPPPAGATKPAMKPESTGPGSDSKAPDSKAPETKAPDIKIDVPTPPASGPGQS